MVLNEVKGMLREDLRLRLLLFAALVIQVIICLSAIGIYHPDQYFQIVEFSSYQLNHPSAVGKVWEFSAHLRSTLQVYLFSAWYEACVGLGIVDPYTQLTLLRLVFGLILFVFFNGMTMYYFRDKRRWVLHTVLFILNFSWILPYTRTLFSSEMLSSILFFYALWRYERKGGALLTGFLFALAFYTRFQTGFAIAGVVVWMLFAGRGRSLLPLGAGFLAGVILNTGLDSLFYHEAVFTPYIYFKVNIIEGKAASMGTSSFLVYIGVLIVVVLAPPLSIFLLGAGFRAALLKRIDQPIVVSVVAFIIGHCLVAHKEERFLFPVLNVLPIIIGWGLPGLADWYRRRGKSLRYLLKGMAFFSIGLNGLLLIVLLVTPYSQAIYFTWLLKEHFGGRPATIYSLDHTPFETQQRLPFVFYQHGVSNLEWREAPSNDPLPAIRVNAPYLSATYNDVSQSQGLLDSMGYKKVIYSSRLLWGLNEFIGSMKMNTINDIWVLYKKE